MLMTDTGKRKVNWNTEVGIEKSTERFARVVITRQVRRLTRSRYDRGFI